MSELPEFSGLISLECLDGRPLRLHGPFNSKLKDGIQYWATLYIHPYRGEEDPERFVGFRGTYWALQANFFSSGLPPRLVFGKYIFPFDHSLFLLRTANGLWLKGGRSSTDPALLDKIDLGWSSLLLTPGWKDAAVLSWENVKLAKELEAAKIAGNPPAREYKCLFWHRLGGNGIEESRPYSMYDGGQFSTLKPVSLSDGGFRILPDHGERQIRDWALLNEVKEKSATLADPEADIRTSQFDDSQKDALIETLKNARQLNFPQYPVSKGIQGFDDAQNRAFSEIKHTLRGRVEFDTGDGIDFRTLSRSELKKCENDLKYEKKWTAAHDSVRDILGFYLTVKDELYEYIDSAIDYIQNQFSVQQSVVSEIASQLSITELHPRGALAGDTVISILGVVRSTSSVAGSFIPGIGTFSAILDASISLYSALEKQPDDALSNASVAMGTAKILDIIRTDFFKICYQLENLRNILCESSSSLEAWYQIDATWVSDTKVLDTAVNEIFCAAVWRRLIAEACVIECVRYEEGLKTGIGRVEEEYFDLEKKLSELRSQDPAYLAVERRSKIIPGRMASEINYMFYHYRLKLRTAALPRETYASLVEKTGHNARSLFDRAGIPHVNESNGAIDYSDTERDEIVF